MFYLLLYCNEICSDLYELGVRVKVYKLICMIVIFKCNVYISCKMNIGRWLDNAVRVGFGGESEVVLGNV